MQRKETFTEFLERKSNENKKEGLFAFLQRKFGTENTNKKGLNNKQLKQVKRVINYRFGYIFRRILRPYNIIKIIPLFIVLVVGVNMVSMIQSNINSAVNISNTQNDNTTTVSGALLNIFSGWSPILIIALTLPAVIMIFRYMFRGFD